MLEVEIGEINVSDYAPMAVLGRSGLSFFEFLGA
jgi:hypothetical protein